MKIRQIEGAPAPELLEQIEALYERIFGPGQGKRFRRELAAHGRLFTVLAEEDGRAATRSGTSGSQATSTAGSAGSTRTTGDGESAAGSYESSKLILEKRLTD